MIVDLGRSMHSSVDFLVIECVTTVCDVDFQY